MQFDRLKRRELIALLGGAAATLPLAAHAQQPAMPVVGFLGSASPEGYVPLVAGFRRGLSEVGWIEGGNVAIQYLWAQNQYDLLPMLAADLVRRQVAVIFAAGAPNSALAAKSATSTLPVVFANGSNPVSLGLVASMSRPGANITGVSFINDELVQKRIELLHEVVPQPARIAIVVNPNNLTGESAAEEAREAAHTLGRQLEVFRASTQSDIDKAFASMIQLHAGGFLLAPDPFFNSRSGQLGAQATGHRLPALYSLREFAVGGGWISFGVN